MKKKFIIIGIMCLHIVTTYAGISCKSRCEVAILDGGFHSTLVYDNIFSLINTVGDVNDFLTFYDFPKLRTSIPHMLYVDDEFTPKGGICGDMFIYIKSFYEVLGREPNAFAKSIMKNCIYQIIKEKPTNANSLVAGWEFLKGNIVPQDTILGKHYLQLVSDVLADSLDQYILPFWRDSISESIYSQKHDSIVKEWGKRRDYHLTFAVEEYGDTLAYKELIENDADGHFLIYTIYMIDQYDYKPAYKDILLSLKKYYAYNKKDTLGKTALLWINGILIDNRVNIPDDIFKVVMIELMMENK